MSEVIAFQLPEHDFMEHREPTPAEAARQCEFGADVLRVNSGTMKAKQYTLTLTQEEAEAVGFALKRASRALEKTKDLDDAEGDTYWKSFRKAMRSAYDNLDTCPVKEVDA